MDTLSLIVYKLYMAKEKYLRDKVSMSGNLQHHFKRRLLAKKKKMLPTCFGFWG